MLLPHASATRCGWLPVARAPLVIVDVGARYEDAESRGAAYFIDRLAYKSTAKRSHSELMTDLERLGGNFMCSSNRESVMYHVNAFQSDLDEVIELLSEVGPSRGICGMQLRRSPRRRTRAATIGPTSRLVPAPSLLFVRGTAAGTAARPPKATSRGPVH